MYCGHCGKEIANDAKYCQYCGEAVLTSKEESTEQVSTSADGFLTQKISKRKAIPKFRLLIGCGVLVVLVLLFGGKNGITRSVESLLENDLGVSISVNTLYYNEEKQTCLVEFETRTTIDVAAIYLDSEEILYESDSDYYQRKFKNATSSAERGRWSSKVLEYSELIEWKFGVVSSGLPEKSGWKRIK